MFDMTPFYRNTDWLSRSSGRSLFEHVFPEWNGERRENGFVPFHVDVQEMENCYVVEADLPGLKREDIEVQFENQFLHIWAQRHSHAQNEENQGNYLHKERFWGQMSRSFYFDHIHREGITAGFTDGVLKITLPKDKDAAPAKTHIPIH